MPATARRLTIAPAPEDLRRQHIGELCAQTDLHLGNPPGTAERGIYFWHWPPEIPGAETLTALYADAVELLHTVITGKL